MATLSFLFYFGGGLYPCDWHTNINWCLDCSHEALSQTLVLKLYIYKYKPSARPSLREEARLPHSHLPHSLKMERSLKYIFYFYFFNLVLGTFGPLHCLTSGPIEDATKNQVAMNPHNIYCTISNCSAVTRHRDSGCGRNWSIVPSHSQNGWCLTSFVN